MTCQPCGTPDNGQSIWVASGTGVLKLSPVPNKWALNSIEYGLYGIETFFKLVFLLKPVFGDFEVDWPDPPTSRCVQ
jgi:hypothetical protein